MKLFALQITLALAMSRSVAQEDAILPPDFPASRYTELWKNSPFNREVVARVKPVGKSRNNFAAHYVLEGLVDDEREGAIAYIKDMKEDKFLVVRQQKSEGSPLYVVQANRSANPTETIVTISNGQETAEIRYAEGAYTKKITGPPKAAPQAANRARLPLPSARNTNAGSNITPPGSPSSRPSNESQSADDNANPSDASENNGDQPEQSNPSSTSRRVITIPSRQPSTGN